MGEKKEILNDKLRKLEIKSVMAQRLVMFLGIAGAAAAFGWGFSNMNIDAINEATGLRLYFPVIILLFVVWPRLSRSKTFIGLLFTGIVPAFTLALLMLYFISQENSTMASIMVGLWIFYGLFGFNVMGKARLVKKDDE